MIKYIIALVLIIGFATYAVANIKAPTKELKAPTPLAVIG